MDNVLAASLQTEIRALRREIGELRKATAPSSGWRRLAVAAEETGLDIKTIYGWRNTGKYPALFGDFKGVKYMNVNVYWETVGKDSDARVSEACSVAAAKKLRPHETRNEEVA